MTKVEAVLPETLRRVVLETPFFAATGSSAPAGELTTLRRAIGERRVIHFQYRRGDGEESQRDVRPLGLFFWGRSWTLAAWCEARSDYRSFRPDRMSDVRLLERSFDPADGISLAGFLAKRDPEEWERWDFRESTSPRASAH
jgi:predicted DNA-binding transcriptional regulator YafY